MTYLFGGMLWEFFSNVNNVQSLQKGWSHCTDRQKTDRTAAKTFFITET